MPSLPPRTTKIREACSGCRSASVHSSQTSSLRLVNADPAPTTTQPTTTSPAAAANHAACSTTTWTTASSSTGSGICKSCPRHRRRPICQIPARPWRALPSFATAQSTAQLKNARPPRMNGSRCWMKSTICRKSTLRIASPTSRIFQRRRSPWKDSSTTFCWTSRPTTLVSFPNSKKNPSSSAFSLPTKSPRCTFATPTSSRWILETSNPSPPTQPRSTSTSMRNAVVAMLIRRCSSRKMWCAANATCCVRKTSTKTAHHPAPEAAASMMPRWKPASNVANGTVPIVGHRSSSPTHSTPP
mmetsp:Transcript_11713/g.33763  ORF Transcript_11713/g.33763 Transcript_11713/m.33763 type:complete len:300 (+) Transcript_11713:1653-2552(+)